MVPCVVCKREFDLSCIKYHLSNSKTCKAKYPKDAWNSLLMKCDERQKFLEYNKKERFELAKQFAHLQEIRAKSKAWVASMAEHHKTFAERKAKSNNSIYMSSMLESMENIEWRNFSEDIKDEILAMEKEIKQLYDSFEEQIRQAALKVKDFQDFRLVGQVFHPLNGGPMHTEWYGKGLIMTKWKDIKTKIGKRVQEIADQINKPLKCFFCPSKEELCQECKQKKSK